MGCAGKGGLRAPRLRCPCRLAFRDAPADWLSELYEITSLTTIFRYRPWVRTPFVCCDLSSLANFQPYPYVGFDFRSADMTLMLEAPPAVFEAAVGNYDAEVTASRLEACDECIAPDEVVEYGGLSYYSWGEDFAGRIRNRFSPPLFDHAGRAGRLAVGEGFVVRAHHTEGVRNMIDSINEETPSLDDLEDYQLAAQALVGMDTYAVGITSKGLSLDEFLWDCRPSSDEVSSEELAEMAKSRPLLEPFTVAATGYAFESPEDTAHSVLALVHEDAAAARANEIRLIERLRIDVPCHRTTFISGPWGHLVERVETSVDGNVLLARLFPVAGRSPEAAIWVEAILWSGGVLLHE